MSTDTPSSAPTRGDVLDLAALDTRFGGSQEIIDEIVATCLEELPELEGQLHAAIKTQNGAAIAAAAHALKGSLANISATPAQQVAGSIEKLAQQGSVIEAVACIANLVTALENLRQALAASTPQERS